MFDIYFLNICNQFHAAQPLDLLQVSALVQIR